MSLKERFAAGSRFDSTGEFTLDESKAKQKMARFQLASPSEFLMLVVQAAVAAKCREIAVTQVENELHLVAKAADLEPEAVRENENFLFEHDDDTVAYHLLGVAANAVEVQCEAPPIVAMVDGDLHFEAKLKTPLSELEELSRERLAYLPCPLKLQDQLLPTRAIPEDAELQISGKSSVIVLVKYGVVVHRETSQRTINFRAVAVADQLGLDASYSQVVKDARYQELITKLDKQANEALALEVRDNESPESHQRWLSFLFDQLPNPAGEALENAPLFPLADRAGEVSFKEIKGLVSRQGKVFVARRRFNVSLETPCLLLSDPNVNRVLDKLLPPKSRLDAEAEVQEQQLIAARRKAWESSPRPLELPPGDYICQSVVEGRGWSAAIGFWAGQVGSNSADILYQGKLLSTATLNDVPLGATAVIDVTEGEVAENWVALVEQREKEVLKQVQSEMVLLWRSQESIPRAALSPRGVKALLNDLTTRDPTPAAKNSPLFPTLDGGYFSFRELEAMEEVRVGLPVDLSARAVAGLGNDPILLYSPELLQALQAVLGRKRVMDLRERQEALAQLDQAWSSPRPPLVRRLGYLKKVEFVHQDCHGEIALYPEDGGGAKVELLHLGAPIQTLEFEGGKVLSLEASVEAPSLTLAASLGSFVRDKAFAALMAALAKEARQLESEAFFHNGPSLDQRLALLAQYPLPAEEVAGVPLFPTTQPGELLSLQRLRAELAKHGHILIGSGSLRLYHRPVILQEAAEGVREMIPEATLAQAEQVLTERRKLEVFEAQPLSRPSLGPKYPLSWDYPVRFPLDDGRGEIALVRDGAKDGGVVYAYVKGRLVCAKSRVLPPQFAAALEHPDFVLNKDYTDVSVPESVHEFLKVACDRCMLKAAKQRLALGIGWESASKIRLKAWAYFASDVPAAESKDEFLEKLEVKLLDGSSIFFPQLAKAKLQGYVDPRFQGDSFTDGMVVRASAKEAELLSRWLGKRLTPQDTFLRKAMSRRKALAELPTTLDPTLFQRIFERENLKARLGISLEGDLIALDGEGQPLGKLPYSLRLPVTGLVWGATPVKKEEATPRARLPRPLLQALEEWSEELCLSWVQGLDGHPGLEHERRLALELLKRSVPEISKKGRHSGSRLADLLWDLPLFSRVDKTLISGSALAATLAETREPILVAESRFRAPGSALVFSDNGPEKEILSSILGKSGLQQFEAPSLLDREEIAKSAKSLLSWGLAPAVAGLKVFSKASDRVASLSDFFKQEESDARDPREVLLVQLREDIRGLLGRKHYQESDLLFQNLDFGTWPLGPPVYRPLDLNTDIVELVKTVGGLMKTNVGELIKQPPKVPKRNHYRLNSSHPAIRWLLSREAPEADRRAVRMLLVIHWVGLVNEASEQLADSHEDAFLSLLAGRMAQTFSERAEPSAEKSPPEESSPASPKEKRKRARQGRSWANSPFASGKKGD